VNARRDIGAKDLWLFSAAALGLLLVWHLASVLLLVFAGVLLAVALRTLSEPLQTHLHLAPRPALALLIVLLVAGISLLVWATGAQALEHIAALRETLPRAVEAVERWLASHAPGRWLLELWQGAQQTPENVGRLATFARVTLNAGINAAGATVLLLALGIYLAADPKTYRRGMLKMVPLAHRERAERILGVLKQQLSRWLLGQAVSMVAVALLTLVGLLAIGMPLAVPLAVIAGIFEFVPYFGSIASGVLVVIIALADGETQAVRAALVCFVVQQAEAYLVQPIAQRWAVRLPPALALIAVLVFGLLFGLAGALLAVPLMVLTMTLVEQLYVKEINGDAVVPEGAASETRSAVVQRKLNR
jgi:predicted PurR-regulated permease PerM